jgi:taurine dioxygenase
MFAGTVHAFATLDDETKARLRGRHGFHSLIAQSEMKKHTGKGRHVPLTDEQKAPNPDRCHPHVWPHPRSGRNCLYVNEGTTFGKTRAPCVALHRRIGSAVRSILSAG